MTMLSRSPRNQNDPVGEKWLRLGPPGTSLTGRPDKGTEKCITRVLFQPQFWATEELSRRLSCYCNQENVSLRLESRDMFAGVPPAGADLPATY